MKLLKEIRECTACKNSLPHKPNPIANFSTSSRIILIGQAPGLKVHKSGIPWNDASGERLREWLGVTEGEFYDPNLFGIVPMCFCYPGKGKSGDRPPRPECAELWMQRVLKTLKKRKLIILIGQYSQTHFLGDKSKENLTETVRNWKAYLPEYFVLPHPSPRNNIWLAKNPWFTKTTLKMLQKQVRKSLEI